MFILLYSMYPIMEISRHKQDGFGTHFCFFLAIIVNIPLIPSTNSILSHYYYFSIVLFQTITLFLPP